MKKTLFLVTIFLSFISLNTLSAEESIFIWGETDVIVEYGEDLELVLRKVKNQIKLKPGYEDERFYIENNNVNYTSKNSIYTNRIGKYRLDHRAVSPKYNKKEVRSFYFHVVDVCPPVVLHSKIFKLNVGSNKPNYLEGFIYQDDVSLNENITITIDDSNVNYNRVGNYEIIYTLMDESGNITFHLEDVYIVNLMKPSIIQIKPLIHNVGTKFNIEDYFLINDNYDDYKNLNISFNFDSPLTEIGYSTITITVTNSSNNKERFTGIFEVVDMTPPFIKLKEEVITLEVNSLEIDLLNYIEVEDNYDQLMLSDVNVVSNINYDLIGTYEVIYSAKDSSNNEAIKKLKVIIKDNIKPIITVEDVIINKYEIVDFLTYVEVSDNYTAEEDIVLRIVNSNVDSEKPGIYQVTFLAIDESGNHTKKTIKVTVKGIDDKQYIYFIVLTICISAIIITTTIIIFKKFKKTS